MLHTTYSYEVLIGFVIFMCVSKTEAQFFPSNDNTSSVRPTISEFPILPKTFSSLSAYANNAPVQKVFAVPPSNTYSASSNGNLASAGSKFVSSTGNSASSSGNFASARSNFATGNIGSPGVNTVSSSVSNYLPPAVEDNTNAFAKAVLALPELQNLSQFQVPGPEASDLLTNIATNILNNLGHPTPSTTGQLVGQGAAGYERFTLPIYFQTVGYTLQKFFQSEGAQSIPYLADKYASIIANAIRSADVNSSYSLFSNILDGFVYFIQLNGYDFNEKAEDLALVFSGELQQAQRG